MDDINFRVNIVGFEFSKSMTGHGWPDTIVVDNDRDISDETYESRSYIPTRTCRNIGNRGFICSECGYVDDIKPRNFCENCGAKVINDIY